MADCSAWMQIRRRSRAPERDWVRSASAPSLVQANFEHIGDVARERGFGQVDGILFDLGLSSHQLADDERAFSFRAEGPLDMRFDTSRGVPASELIATLDEAALTDLFRRYGEEPHARRIARAIVARARRRAHRDRRAAGGRRASVPPGARLAAGGAIHPATRVFQALRIAVNRELETLPAALAASLDLLKPDGRLAVISYHSLEDRIVKRFVAAERRGCTCPPELPVCVCGRARGWHRSARSRGCHRGGGRRQPAGPQRQAARGPEARRMSRAHSSSRRRNYGRRQSDVRRRGRPSFQSTSKGRPRWPRGSGWDHSDRIAATTAARAARQRHRRPR